MSSDTLDCCLCLASHEIRRVHWLLCPEVVVICDSVLVGMRTGIGKSQNGQDSEDKDRNEGAYVGHVVGLTGRKRGALEELYRGFMKDSVITKAVTNSKPPDLGQLIELWLWYR